MSSAASAVVFAALVLARVPFPVSSMRRRCFCHPLLLHRLRKEGRNVEDNTNSEDDVLLLGFLAASCGYDNARRN